MLRILLLLLGLALPLSAQTATTDSGMSELVKNFWTAHSLDNPPTTMICLYGTMKHLDSVAVHRICHEAIGGLYLVNNKNLTEENATAILCDLIATKDSTIHFLGFLHGIGIRSGRQMPLVWGCWR